MTNLLPSLLQEVISKTNSTKGRICLKDTMPGAGEQERAALLLNGGMSEAVSQRRLDKCAVCAAFYERNRIDPLIVHDGKPSVHCSRMRRTAGSSVAILIRYRESVLGVMTLTSNRENHYSETLLEICQRFTHEMAYLIKRYQRHDLIKATLDKDLVFMGTSDALGKVDRFLKKASQVDLPVLIVGEFGSEKMYIACSLHCEGPRRDHPFVEVVCPSYESHTFKSEVYDLFRQANGGTIFLKGIDELEYKLQYQLAELIESAGEPRTGHTKRSKLNEVRIVASASRDPERLVEEGKFCPSLLGKIDFLKIRIAPLRERREDIEPLIEYFLRKYTGERTHHISDEVLKLCQAYDWPSNVDEIERVIARLAVMAEDKTIEMRDLYAHVPKLVQRWQAPQQKALPASEPHRRVKEQKLQRIEQTDARLVALADDLIRGEFTKLRKLHLSLQKALEHIARHFHEPISLRQLAQHAHLSPSHLSHLFKQALGVSFKPFLSLVRIKRAAQLLVEKPYQSITETSLEVGFNDLRHFERAFKRLLDLSPRSYRRNALEQGNLEMPLSWYHEPRGAGTAGSAGGKQHERKQGPGRANRDGNRLRPGFRGVPTGIRRDRTERNRRDTPGHC